jgi:sodium-dependent dicarboxylate transporter 2/3/5
MASNAKSSSPQGGLPPMPSKIYLSKGEKQPVDWKRILFILLGIALFCIVNFSPPWSSVTDPQGKVFELSAQGKAAIGLFLLAAIWWVFEVVPIGITAIVIGVIQVLFLIRDPHTAFTDFMDPSVWFIFASISVGLAFSKTGLTQRMAYKMLTIVGEKTSMIYLGSFIMVGFLTLIMAHTAVAAAVFPLLMTITNLYDDSGKPTKFGKGLFIGMAFVAGAGSIVTLLGAARGAVAIGFLQKITGIEVSFFELTYYMLPIGWLMIFIIWIFLMIVFKPEKATIPGLRERAKKLSEKLGPIKRSETLTIILVFSAISLLILRSFIPELKILDKSAIMLVPIVSLFVFKVLTVKDLEDIPWNIILLFGGAMCIGFCLDQTGAANWLAVNWLMMFQDANWFVFVISISFLVLVLTNFIMNVAAIAIVLPIAFVIGSYLGVSPYVIFFSSLVTAGMPFMLLIGAAPNAIAYESKQFTTGQFLTAGIPMSAILLIVLAIFVRFIWPLMGMKVTL